MLKEIEEAVFVSLFLAASRIWIKTIARSGGGGKSIFISMKL